MFIRRNTVNVTGQLFLEKGGGGGLLPVFKPCMLTAELQDLVHSQVGM